MGGVEDVLVVDPYTCCHALEIANYSKGDRGLSTLGTSCGFVRWDTSNRAAWAILPYRSRLRNVYHPTFAASHSSNKAGRTQMVRGVPRLCPLVQVEFMREVSRLSRSPTPCDGLRVGQPYYAPTACLKRQSSPLPLLLCVQCATYGGRGMVVLIWHIDSLHCCI